MGQTMMEEKQKDYKTALAVAIRFLNHKDRTEHEIFERLNRDEYPESIILEVISYLREQSYLNDRRYAEYYFTCYVEKRSIKRIEMELARKGIEQSIIDNIKCTFGKEQGEAVRKALKKQLVKRKINDYNLATYEEKSMIKAALYRQGYSVEDISGVLDNM